MKSNFVMYNIVKICNSKNTYTCCKYLTGTFAMLQCVAFALQLNYRSVAVGVN